MGALVAGVTEGGPAEAAGIEPGDVIVEFDGSDVPAMRDLPRIVADTDVGKAVDVVVLRKGDRVTVAVELGRLEEGERLIAERKNGSAPGEKAEPSEVLGLMLEALSAESREKYKIGEDIEGVLVTAVEPASSAEEKRVIPGDVIVEVSQEAVSTPAEVADRVAQLKSEGRRSALLLIAGKDDELRFVAVRIEEESDPAPDGKTQEQ